MDDAGGLGGVDAEGVHGGHDVVAADLLLLAGDVEGLVRGAEVGPHLVEGLVGDLPRVRRCPLIQREMSGLQGHGTYLSDAEILLGLGEPRPQLAPGPSARARAEEGQHLLGGVAPREGCLVRVVVRHGGGCLGAV